MPDSNHYYFPVKCLRFFIDREDGNAFSGMMVRRAGDQIAFVRTGGLDYQRGVLRAAGTVAGGYGAMDDVDRN